MQKTSGAFWHRRFALVNVDVIADMLFAVTVVAVALGTVAKLQIGMAHISSSADGAAVVIGGPGRFLCRVNPELDDFVPLGLRCLAELLLHFDTPGTGQQIQNIRTKEQEVVCQGDDGKKVGREAERKEIQQYNCQIDQSEEPGFYGDDKKQQETGVGVHGGVTKEQTEIQIGHVGPSTENQTVDVHQYHAGKIEEIKPEGTPAHLHGSAQCVVTEKGDGNEQQIGIARTVGQGIGEKPPHLAPENQTAVKQQQTVQSIVTGHLADNIDDGSAYRNIKHEIGNTFVPVPYTETVKAAAQIFQ